MALYITRGSTPTIKLKPSGVSISELGTPTIAIAQEYLELALPAEVDNENGLIFVKLTESQTLDLVPGVDVRVQAIYKNNDHVIRFPIHLLTVLDTLMGEVEDDEEVVDNGNG